MSPTDDDFPPDYAERIERVCREAVADLKSCHGDLFEQLKACCRYFERGDQEGSSHEELIDLLGISSPSVLDRAGYSDSEALQVMASLQFIRYDEQGKPHPPDSLPLKVTASPPEQTDFGF
ncbi:MAG TPA: hypothetical protein VMF08_22025 [Candidatus Sulfotelmatobacter sp.]|nr:hypothetical protein [Candidatus Sulfotelmatobacter sp.]